jgi:cytidylate kinase
MYPPYPVGVGHTVPKSLFAKKKIEKLAKKIPKNALIRIYGLAGVGKGSLSFGLAQLLGIPHLEVSYILRAITYIFERYNMPFTDENVRLAFTKLGAYIDEHQMLQLQYAQAPLDRGDLKNSQIDTSIARYSSEPMVRYYYNHYVSQFLQHHTGTPLVIDSRGAMPPYLDEAIRAGKDVTQFLIVCSEKVTFERYYSQKIVDMHSLNPHFHPTSLTRQTIHEQFEKDIVERNDADIATILAHQIGLITPDSYLIDSSMMSVDEMIGSALTTLDLIYR